MREVGAGIPLGARPPADERARLRQAAQDLEAVFLTHLLQAMRDTVPQDGFIDAAPGQDLFTAMLDDKIAQDAAERSPRGLGEMLYRQLARHLTPADPSPAHQPSPARE